MESIYKYLYLLLAIPVLFLLAKRIYESTRFRITIILLHAIVLTFLTIFVFNNPSWRWSDYESTIGLVKSEQESPYVDLKEKFILIDNSFDKELIPNPEGDADDSTSIIVTNRRKLASFFRLLNDNSKLVDLVVLDINLDEPTTHDSLLQSQLLGLYANDKLLKSIDCKNGSSRTMIMDKNIYGDVNEESHGKLFVSHVLRRNECYSLPYKIYEKANAIHNDEPFFFDKLFWEYDSLGKKRLVLNTFLPDFTAPNEEVLFDKRTPGASASGSSINEEVDYLSYFQLGQALSEYGRETFVDNLNQRKSLGLKNIVLIGSFQSSSEDVHQTLYGNLHGPVILLNVFLALINRDHILTVGLISLLLSGYCLISFVLVYSRFKLPLSFGMNVKKRSFTDQQKKPGYYNKLPKLLRAFLDVCRYVLNFALVEELHFLLLILLVLATKYFLGYVVNAMSLLFYLSVLNLGFDYAYQNLVKKN